MNVGGKNSMRGLTVFITDVRNAQNKEDEEKRVNKEMAKIRKKFKEAKEIDGYARKKYVAKLIYMFMLGYDLDFGYMEAVTLLSSNKFQEKLMGYLGLAILLHENHEMLPLIIQSLQNDLQSRNDSHQALALTAIGNIGGKEMAESLAPIVQKVLTAKATKTSIKKKAALCLLRLFRKFPDCVSSDVWMDKMLLLLDETDLGLITASMGLLLGLAQENAKAYEGAVKKVIWILTKIIMNRDYTKDYVYYNIANPWLQVKLLRFLSYYGPPEDTNAKAKLYEILNRILSSADVAKGQTVNHKNALNAVLFEAIDLVIRLDDDRELIRLATSLLGRFIAPKEHSNIRYLALAALGHVAGLDSETANLVKKHQEIVVQALRDADISIRKRALDLLYGMCDKGNAKAIVSELLSYLATADFAIREELVIKIAILAEKFAHDYSWYVDVILQLIALAGDFVSDDIWYRVVQIVTNHEDIQEYAAKTVYNALKHPSCHETGVKVGGYILGEFGHLIADNPNSSPTEQFEVLNSKFPIVSFTAKNLLLSTFVKFANVYPELADMIRPVFKAHQASLDAELQQRACEYWKITNGSDELMQTVLDVMPVFPERNTEGGVTQGEHSGENKLELGELSEPRESPARKTPVEQPKKFDPLLELDGILGGGAAPAVASTVPHPGSSVGHFEAAASPLTATSVASPTPLVGTTGVEQREEVSEQLKKAIMLPEGVLHQDQYMQIGFKSEYSNGMGRMMLYYGNVSAFQFTSFRTAVTPVPYLSFNVQPVGAVVEPRTQMQQLIAMTSTMADFTAFPSLQVAFLANGVPVQFQVKLPIVLTRFVEPVPYHGPDFFSLWKTIENAPLSQQTIIKSSKPIDIAWVNKILSTGFHLAVLQGVDPNLNNIIAAGAFPSSGQKVPCLIRIETNASAGMYRATIKSSSAQVSLGLKQLLEIELS